MAKKAKSVSLIKSDNQLVKELSQVEWLKQPWVYTLIGGDFSLVQINIMIQITRQLQGKINDFLHRQKKCKGNDMQLSLFSEEEIRMKAVDFTIPLAAICKHPKDYDELDEACEMMNKIRMSYTVFKNGIQKKVYESPFARVVLNRIVKEDGTPYKYKCDDEHYKYKEDKEDEKKKKKKGKSPKANVEGRRSDVTVTMLTSSLDMMFSMSQGYINYRADITSLCRRKSTARLYIYLQRWKEKGHVVVNFIDLKEYLGIIERTDDGELIKDKYPKFSRFCSSVLDPIKEEIGELSKCCKIDIHFDYKPEYKNGKKRGNPDNIVFSIFHSQMGRSHKEITSEAREQIEIQDYLKGEFGIAPSDTKRLFKILPDELFAGFKKEVYSLKEKVDKNKPNPEKLQGYVMTILRRFIESNTPSVEEVKDAPTEQESVVSIDASQKQEENFTEEELRMWGLFLQIAEGEMPVHEYDIWFKNMNFGGYKDGTLFIRVPSQFFCQYIEEHYISVLRKSVYGSFGEGTNLQYRLG